METDIAIIHAVRAIVSRCGLSYNEAAIAARVSPGTMKDLLQDGRMPERSRPRLQIARWANHNAGAATRESVRFV
jgi:hypothetical protein